MEKDTFKTKVLFLIDQDHDLPSVFAFFPENKEDDKGEFFSSYARIGQHSTCSIWYANDCEEATKEKAANLVSELESIGYNLEILNKW